MRARKNFSYRALLSLQSAPILRKGKRPSLNLGDDTNFFAQFECAPLSSIIRRGVYSSGLGNYLVSLVNNIENRDELAQEIFLKVWLRLHQLRQPSSFKPWLYRIATNVVSDFRRRKRLSCDTLEDKNEIEDVEKFEEQIAEEELVKLALKKVPWKYRVCLLYNYRGTALPK
jgi:RNA polymerase sigma factor (sigma-70 family)